MDSEAATRTGPNKKDSTPEGVSSIPTDTGDAVSPTKTHTKKRSYDEALGESSVCVATSDDDGEDNIAVESDRKRMRRHSGELQKTPSNSVTAEPITDSHNDLANKEHSEKDPNADETRRFKLKIKSGVYSNIGMRPTMEDTHVALDDARRLVADYCNTMGSSMISFFAVYDGHAGKRAADYLQSHLHIRLFQQPEFAQRNFVDALKTTFKQIDKELVTDGKGLSTGSTAAVTLIVDKMLYIANVGDTEAVLVSKTADGKPKGEALTKIHKPTDPDELKRILDLGGSVFVGRVFGMLAVSRAFGDKDFKTPADFVSAEPAVDSIQLTPEHECIVIGCDGLWDVVTYMEVANAVLRMKEANETPDTVANKLVQMALEHGSEDNVTVVVIYLNWTRDTGEPDTPPIAATPPLNDTLNRTDTENQTRSDFSNVVDDTEELSSREASPTKSGSDTDAADSRRVNGET